MDSEKNSMETELSSSSTDNRPQKFHEVKLTRWQRGRKFVLRLARYGFYALLFYGGCVILGLLPANRGFQSTADGVEVFVFSGSVHSDIILPVRLGDFDWRDHFPQSNFKRPIGHYSHVAIGWGDRGFFLETPTWEDLKVSTAAKAILLPSSSVMHVHYSGRPKQSKDCRAVRITQQQYDRLAAFILASTDREADETISYSYWSTDAFFPASGHYHLFNTCNSWVGRAMRSAGLKVGWFTPLPGTPLLYLPDHPSEGA